MILFLQFAEEPPTDRPQLMTSASSSAGSAMGASSSSIAVTESSFNRMSSGIGGGGGGSSTAAGGQESSQHQIIKIDSQNSFQSGSSFFLRFEFSIAGVEDFVFSTI